MKKLALVVALVVVAPAAAADAPHVRHRIVPGASIGSVKIGMSLEQVRGLLGQPEAVIKRERRSFTRTWVEYGWSFTTWRVGFEVYRGTYRVVSIRSSVRGERTREEVGYGTPATRVHRVYGTACRPAWSGRRDDRDPSTQSSRFLGYGCVVRSPRGGVAFFLVNEFCGNVPNAGRCSAPGRRWAVSEFGVVASGERIPFELGEYTAQYPPLR